MQTIRNEGSWYDYEISKWDQSLKNRPHFWYFAGMVLLLLQILFSYILQTSHTQLIHELGDKCVQQLAEYKVSTN